MNTPTHDDPFAAADNSQIRPPEFWGKLEVDAWFCALIKGQGKVPYDATLHPADQRRTAIDMHIISLPSINLNYPVTRSLIAESNEWSKIVWPSLRDLGINSLRDLKDAEYWCRATTEPTGRTYNSNGVTKQATTFRFLELYKSESECDAAYLVSREPDWLDSPAPAAPAVNGTNHAEQRERETALAFARILVKQSGSVVELASRLAEFPLVSKYFTVDSPEIQQEIALSEVPVF